MHAIGSARSWRVTPAVWDQLLLNFFFSSLFRVLDVSLREACIHFEPVPEGRAGHDGWGRWRGYQPPTG